ncbi:hypothetical protein [Paludisphaera soli]|uniref:hypothetical protein n=1 Tax=Paludisphaera soli TaxID=2712865 RepID=UPI0013ED4E8B|nr:hypothetical protein [Paludisphaera soli]
MTKCVVRNARRIRDEVLARGLPPSEARTFTVEALAAGFDGAVDQFLADFRSAADRRSPAAFIAAVRRSGMKRRVVSAGLRAAFPDQQLN